MTDEPKMPPNEEAETTFPHEPGGEEATETPVLPAEMNILPTGESVVFPFMVFPMVVRDEKSVALVTDVVQRRAPMAMVPLREPGGGETVENLSDYGTAASILRVVRAGDGSLQLIVRGVSRVRVEDVIQTEPFMRGGVEQLQEILVETPEVEALRRSLLSLFQRIVNLSPSLPEEVLAGAQELSEPGRLADLVASALDLTHEQKLELLGMGDVAVRLRRVAEYATRELEVLELGSEIQNRIKGEIDKNQREYYLREQLRQIERELGEITGEKSETGELRERIEAGELPEEVRKQAEDELSRLDRIPAASPEYGIIRTYLDWLLCIPWGHFTTDNLDLNEAQRILDEEHYDLEKIKERILEFLAVHRLRGEMKGPILCFVGPPGVGKTSLGQSIAHALGRKFIRISLGGVRDEAEIRGHRRTYIGAMPGRIIQGLRRVESMNPVFMLDEIDKLGAGFQGDPSAALLEVLDPAQNSSFTDHYLDVAVDLSRVLFVATANVLDTIPAPLRDRMEVLELSGYTEAEKLHIARRYLVPRQIRENGLKDEQLHITDGALSALISGYTREAGVRQLEREIGSVARKVAREVAQESVKRVTVDVDNVEEYLGHARFHREVVEESDEVGVVTGMAWTATGGDILFVEAAMMPGRGNLTLTGQLGDVMQESARAALTFVRSHSKQFAVADDFYEKHDFHLHVPAGAIPKDGPSAGVTMATALASVLSGRKVDKEVAMTGEVTLRGHVLPIGGLKEKALAAHRAGVKTVIFPKDNEQDLQDIPDDVRRDLTFVPVSTMDEVLDRALRGRSEKPKRTRRKQATNGREAAAAGREV